MSTPGGRGVDDVLVVGASLAGVGVARALRELGHAGEVVLVGQEPHRPYDRPPLSKEFLEGGDEAPPPLLGPDGPQVDLRLGQEAVALLTDGGRPAVRLAGGEVLDASRLVIATGAVPRRLPGDTLPGIHVLRTHDDAVALRQALRTASSVVVIGAGFIGSELASVARGRGLPVTVVEASQQPLAAALGPAVARRCIAEHGRNGTRLLTGQGVDGFTGDGRVEGVRLADGTLVPAHLVVVGVGAVPAVDWLRGSELALDQGVLVDERGRTSLPGVWAAGDCAQTWDERQQRHVRSEHWTHAVVQSRAVARDLLGLEQQPAPLPYVWSHQYGRTIQLAGHVRPQDEVRVLDGDLDGDGPLVVLYERDGEPVGVLGIDEPRRFTRLRRSLERGLPLD